MAGRQGRQDPKEQALAEARCLNPHPERVTDPGFLASDFFDARVLDGTLDAGARGRCGTDGGDGTE
jgi:hypothetical protein